ncbi:MAG: hypothetical protein HY555_05115, partial [Euryarchaeota archaeon]|nr:hypothetical protein [Euryarchaeota archaeon]
SPSPIIVIFLSANEDLLNFSNKCGFETSIVTNGVFLSDTWLKENIGNLDIIAISLDSGNETIQKSLNRGNGDHIDQTRSAFKRIRYWANELNHEIYIKINLVVSALNKFDTPSSILLELKPNRVKLLQFCRMKGENDEFADKLFISKKEFQNYVDNICPILEKSGIKVVSENEEILWSSYLVLDPQGRFCDKRKGTNKFGPSLVSVSPLKALQAIYSPSDITNLRREMKDRDGLYPVK